MEQAAPPSTVPLGNTSPGNTTDGKILTMKMTSKVTSKGQVTIPLALREKFGLLPETTVEFVDTPQGPRLRRAQGAVSRGAKIVDRMRASKRKLARGTDEIMTQTRG